LQTLTVECVKTRNSYVKKNRVQFPLWLRIQKFDWLENTFHLEIRMGKTHEIFPSMELRVSKLVWWSHIFPIEIRMWQIPCRTTVRYERWT
jgi:hypothetical protein